MDSTTSATREMTSDGRQRVEPKEPPRLQLDGVSLEYITRKQPLRVTGEVNLSVASGELLCILGPSGCGKSSLLYAIAGLPPAFPPAAGQTFVNGKLVTKPGRDRGMVFQEYAIYPWLTVESNVGYGLRLQGVRKKERQEKVDHYLELTNLSAFRRAYPHQLSGGMKQRVSLARALVGEPELMLMDEPFAAVDALTRYELQKELGRIWEATNMTIVFVTHNVEEALLVGSRIVVMSPRPGNVVLDIRNDMGYPRTMESIHADPRYGGMEEQINHALGVDLNEKGGSHDVSGR